MASSSSIWKSSSQVLDYLRASDQDRRVGRHVESDIRFFCSGLLARADRDRKSPSARLLVERPIQLFAVTGEFWGAVPPRDHHELSCRLCTPEFHGGCGQSSTTYFPVEGIANDLAAILTLFFRRLISFATVIGEQESEDPDFPVAPELRYFAMPIAPDQGARVWPRHPLLSVVYPDSQTIIDYNPGPVLVRPSDVADLFDRLCRWECAERFVWAARLYASAMSLIHERSDVAYLLFTQAVEALAGEAIDIPEPTGPPPVYLSRANELGVLDSVARELYALAHLKENAPTHQFREYLIKYIPDSLWTDHDDLWRTNASTQFLPTKETLKKAVNAVYSQRSKYVHTGRPYPPGIAVGLSPMITTEVAMGMMCAPEKAQVPPVTWFERATHAAILQHLRLSTGPVHPIE